MLIRYVILCLCFFFSSAVYSGTIDPSNRDSDYIAYGNKHKCVLPIEGVIKLNIPHEDGSKTISAKYTASCVAIAPRWVITAAHVIKDTDSRFVVSGDKKIEVMIGIIPENFDDNIVGKNDIALCYLDKPLDLDFYPELYSGVDEVGKISSQAGYGATGTFHTGMTKNDGFKRAGSNIVDEIEKDMLICSVHRGKKTSLEFLIARGDSGGGLFIDQKLAGIHSCVFSDDGSPNSDHGDTSGHTRISVFNKWIQETIKAIESLDE
jgi:hypothetical protein